MQGGFVAEKDLGTLSVLHQLPGSFQKTFFSPSLLVSPISVIFFRYLYVYFALFLMVGGEARKVVFSLRKVLMLFNISLRFYFMPCLFMAKANVAYLS